MKSEEVGMQELAFIMIRNLRNASS